MRETITEFKKTLSQMMAVTEKKVSELSLDD